jgi:hypothetical protein
MRTLAYTHSLHCQLTLHHTLTLQCCTCSQRTTAAALAQQTRSPPVVPNLQALPPDWQGAVAGIPTPTAPSRHLPQHRTRHPTDGRVYNTYFMPPTLEAQAALQQYGARNTETCAQVKSNNLLVSICSTDHSWNCYSNSCSSCSDGSWCDCVAVAVVVRA